MPLEAATYPSQLVASNPTATDPKSQGDDHLRLLKQVLQNAFPGLSGPIAATYFPSNLASAGHQSIFVGGFLIQWGTFTTTTTQPGTFNFPTSFPIQCSQIVTSDSGASVYTCAAAPLSVSQFSGYIKNTLGNAVAGTARYIAIGK